MAHVFTKDENRAWQRTLPTKKSSACVAMLHDGKVLMVKASYKHEWTFPGGVVDEGESPQAAALRELHEEVGIQLRPEDLSFLGVVYTAPGDGFLDRYNFAFCTEVVKTDTSFTIGEDEIEATKWVPISEIAGHANNRESYKVFQKLFEDNVSGIYHEVETK